MAWDDDDGESFFSAPPRIGYWRIAIYGAMACALWLFRDPYLAQVKAELFPGNSLRGPLASLFVSALYFPLAAYLWLPPMVKLVGLTVIFGGIVEVAVHAFLLLFAASPFLVISMTGVSGHTSWGRQTVPWGDVNAIRIVAERADRGKVRQLVISTGTLPRPAGWRSLFMPVAAESERVTFVSPVEATAQIPALIRAINFYAPRHLHLPVEPSSWMPVRHRR